MLRLHVTALVLLLTTSALAGGHREAVGALVDRLAPVYHLDPNLVLAVIEAESGFNPKALSSENAQGLMQLIPATAKRFGVRDPWDPEQNLRGGMIYLRWLLNHFNGDVELALAGYNAGERVVERYRGIPPYPETQAYVKRVLAITGHKPSMRRKAILQPEHLVPHPLYLSAIPDGFLR